MTGLVSTAKIASLQAARLEALDAEVMQLQRLLVEVGSSIQSGAQQQQVGGVSFGTAHLHTHPLPLLHQREVTIVAWAMHIFASPWQAALTRLHLMIVGSSNRPAVGISSPGMH